MPDLHEVKIGIINMQKLGNKKFGNKGKSDVSFGVWSILKKKFFCLIYCWLSNCGSCGQEFYSIWNFPDQELSVPCLLHWQANSLLLSHHGSPGNNLEGTLYDGNFFCLLN